MESADQRTQQYYAQFTIYINRPDYWTTEIIKTFNQTDTFFNMTCIIINLVHHLFDQVRILFPSLFDY
jgi:hypothetical protein